MIAIVLAIVWLYVQSTIYLTSGKLRSVLIFRVLGLGKFSFLDYDESKLSLIITVIVNYYRLNINLLHP